MTCAKASEAHGDPLVAVVPIGAVQPLAARVVAGHLIGYLERKAEVTASMAHPGYAFDPARTQYDAGRILASMESLSWDRYERVLGLLDVDIFVPIFTHVFGEARQGGRIALVSMFRLSAGAPRQPLLLERTAKVSLHEIGHLYGLLHCQDPRCLMHFSGDIEDLDATPLQFCRYCTTALRDSLHP